MEMGKKLIMYPTNVSLKDTKKTITYILCIFIESNIINSGFITTFEVRKLLEYFTRGCSVPKH